MFHKMALLDKIDLQIYALKAVFQKPLLLTTDKLGLFPGTINLLTKIYDFGPPGT
ncbi:MAG: hypothetical protein WA004_10850 [Saprospiraceae bacterium]